MKRTWMAAGLSLLCAALLTSCGSIRNGDTEDTGSGQAEILIEDTHQTEFGTESGTEKEDPDDSLVQDLTGDGIQEEDSLIVQEAVTDAETQAQSETAAGESQSETDAAKSGSAGAQSETATVQNGSTGIQAETATGESQSETATGQAQAEGSDTQAQSGQVRKETETAGGPFSDMMTDISGREQLGEKWALAYEDLSDGSQYGYRESEKMQSASVIKLFIMGAVYRYMVYPEKSDELVNFGESYDGELRDTINSMITVSDNDAANLLVERLGQGDFDAGAKLVDQFCQDEGYSQTSLGRRFMAPDLSTGDNITSAADVRKFYSDIWHGKLIGEDASAKMLEILKGQTKKSKIPSGLPEGFTSGNKTGEMPDGYGLGCIENDSAIIFPPEGSGRDGYILTVFSNDLGGRNSEAQDLIRRISENTAEWYLKEPGV